MTNINSNGSTTKVITGSHAVSYGVKSARAEVITAYPITPQTSIVELLSEFCASGALDAEFIKVESEHSAMASLISASAVGARSFTATSAHGLALMHEMLHWAAGDRLPIVMANVNRAMGSPWSIWVDHNDSLSQRDTGWIQYYVSSNQEITDTILQAFKLGEMVGLPVMINLDGFFLSHTVEPVEILDQDKADQFLPKYEPQWKLDLDDPRTIGALCAPDHYFELRCQIQHAMETAKVKAVEVDREFGDLFGRYYQNIETYEIDDAETVLIAYATMAQTTLHTVKQLRRQGRKVGMIRIRLFRPFPTERLLEVIKPDVRYIVLDRNIGFGVSGIFCQEIRSALYRHDLRPKIFDIVLGIGGRDITPEIITGVLDKYEKLPTVDQDFYWEGVMS
ncbi:MAG: pyruvate ferredoxin oxidoreductase [candidate division Zixibacteria bacterium]|nr:pyruvate ferredoxin oxidoreductase [candidate division Zixibacteria bacterium]